jgi:diguanylate cyclase (GGDEF)-like protein
MSNTWIELGLSRPSPRPECRPEPTPVPEFAAPAAATPEVTPSRWLVLELLAVIRETAPESAGLNTDDFRQSLAAYAARLGNVAEDISQEVASECVRCCREFYERARAVLAERETEFSELIRMLTEMVGALGGTQVAFADQLDRTTERLTKMVDINDLRILKRRLAVEVETLRRLSKEKRASDDAARNQFAAEITRLRTRLAQSMEEAALDQLTRIANRGRFERALHEWTIAHRANGMPFVLAMVDVDNFKQINDTEGHQEGDRVLVEIARLLSGGVRSTDLVARYGGDEFVVMIGNSTTSQAMVRITALVERLSAVRAGASPPAPHITVSVGATEWAVDDTADEIVARADGAMYQAKRAGKNRIEVMKRATRSRLFQNGRPVVGVPVVDEQTESLLRRVR